MTDDTEPPRQRRNRLADPTSKWEILRPGRPLAPHERQVLAFLVRHLVYGAIGGLAFGIGILAFDVSGLWTLIWHSQFRWMALGLFLFGLLVTFGSIGMAVGIMSQGEDHT